MPCEETYRKSNQFSGHEGGALFRFSRIASLTTIYTVAYNLYLIDTGSTSHLE